MSRPWLLLALLAGTCAPFVHSTSAAAAELVSVAKIWDQDHHNAFTDLIRFRDRWFCTFREADDHVGGNGKLRVLTSADGEHWESAALLAEEGIDLRDPKLSITADGRLMIVAGGSVYGGTKTLKSRQPRVAFSPDGRQWTATQRVLSEGAWLWRVTWHEGQCYGVAYFVSADAPGGEWFLKLYRSSDGVHFELVTPLEVPDRANETTLRFLHDGTLVALVRREKGDQHAWIGTSRAPYTEWKWHATDARTGGPNFIELPDHSLWAAGRRHSTEGAKTVLSQMTLENLTPVLTLPSGGDNSYPGLVWHDDLLWMSYYSSHEGKTSIYLAKIRLK